MSSSPIEHKHLYRGASDKKVEEDGGLSPPTPGKAFTTGWYVGQKYEDGEPIRFGEGLVYGDSLRNELLFHQYKGLYGTWGISTSPIPEVAERYARGRAGQASGTVYELDVEVLLELGCKIYRVNSHVTDPTVPEDDEHTVVTADFGVVPEAAIVRSYKVSPQGGV